MAFFVNFPLFSIVLCLLCAVLCALLKGKAARIVSLSLCGVVAVLAFCVLVYGLQTGAATEYPMGHYPHPWGNELRFGIAEPLVALVFAVVMLLCLIGGKQQLDVDLEPGKRNLYYVMCDLVLVSLLALAYTNDVFTGYVFIEICTIASCGLLMIRQIGRTTLAATRYMIFSLIGSGLFLLGVILLYGVTGQLLMPSLKAAIAALWEGGQYRTALLSAMTLMTVGLAIKSGLFPFHLWMPDTYAYSTPASAGILSGLVSKGYSFLLIKLVFGVFGTDVFYGSGVSNVLYVFGALGIIVGSISAAREKDVFRMIAFSSAAQIGYLYFGIGLTPALGMLAAIFHLLTHAVTKPLLFLAAGQLGEAAGGRLRHTWRGAAHRNRTAGLMFSLGAFSMIGIPLTMGFVSKYRFALAAFERPTLLVVTLIVLAVSTVLNAMYFMRVIIGIYTPVPERRTRMTLREQRPFAVSSLLLALLNLSAGVAAQPLVLLLERGLSLL
ncbi:MAG: sodium:proton antiporter [Clostridia bacterium]|nr:sodium:proton antiporter [Clostridia bacterium]